jgi:gliding motility-associated-like protein
MKHIIRLFLLLLFSPASAQTLAVLNADAGNNTGVCPGDSVKIGGNPSAKGGTPPYFYSWQPATGLSNPAAPNPNASPASQTTYTLTVTDAASNTSVDVVTVSIYSVQNVSAGPDITILEGTNTMLLGSGATQYFWAPPQTLYNQNSANPIAEPAATTTYVVTGKDGNGCTSYDQMTLTVIPSDTIIIYNAFTPNGDSFNDFFYISNLEKYPDNKLQVFNRNGKLVLQQSPYKNDWDGKVDGLEMPCATYYYIFTPGEGKEKLRGSVTIIR